MTSLREVLVSLDLMEKVDVDKSGEHFTKLVNGLESCGAGIILWDDFWKVASRWVMGVNMSSLFIQTCVRDDGLWIMCEI